MEQLGQFRSELNESIMNSDEFETFHKSLKTFIFNNFNSDLKVYSCQITESIDLYANENVIIKNSVAKRAYEFSAGRMCARKCLAYYDLREVELLKGEFGEPLWPEGYTGSITHHDKVAVAVAAQASVFAGIGIDLVSQKDSIENTDLITCYKELKLLESVGLDVELSILMFSIKESVIKIISPLFQDFIDFRDISLSWSDRGHLCATIARLDRLIKINWLIVNNSIFCIATLDHSFAHDIVTP